MDRTIIEFGKRMDQAEDKLLLVDYAEGATEVLDLGAGTGKISRDIAEKWGAHCDAVDLEFKDNCQNSDKITYYSMDINEFLATSKKKYDCIVLSAILHELSDNYLETMFAHLQDRLADNARILIREPFYDTILGPVVPRDLNTFVDLVKNKLPAGKTIEFAQTPKLNSGSSLNINDLVGIDWVNLSFTISYGDASWEREKQELRYARSLNWCKGIFNFSCRPFTGFQVYPVLDKTYKKHFINAGLPGEAFDLIQYTGMIVVIDYSKGE
jgi:SAM-dependent methyltransferase